MDRLCVIRRTLWDFGFVPRYLGAHYLACAVLLAMEDESRLTMVTKCLYPEVAKRYRTTWKGVERNIRTAIRACRSGSWVGPLARYCPEILERRPSPTGMIQLLARYFLDQPEQFWHLLPQEEWDGQLVIPEFAEMYSGAPRTPFPENPLLSKRQNSDTIGAT